MTIYNYEIIPFALINNDDHCVEGKLYRGTMPWGLHQEESRNLYSKMLSSLQIHKVIVLVTDIELSFASEGYEPNAIDFYKSINITAIHFPIDDGGTPDQEMPFNNLISTIVKSLKQGENVLIHCMGGKGRTGLVLACVIKALLPKEGSTAISHVQTQVRGAIETPLQMQYVSEFVFEPAHQD